MPLRSSLCSWPWPSSTRTRILLASFLVWIGGGCAESDAIGPWQRLEAVEAAQSVDLEAWSRELSAQVLADDEGVWVVHSIESDSLVEGAGGWFSFPRRVNLRLADRWQRTVLDCDGVLLRLRGDARPEELDPGEYGLRGGEVHLRLPDGAAPPRRVAFSEHVLRGERGSRSWKAVVGRASGRGLPVWPGELWRVATPVPPNSTLRFFTAATGDGSGAELTFRVRCDGEELWELSRPGGNEADAWHEVELSPEGSSMSLFELSVEGPPGRSAFLDPVIGPRGGGAEDEPVRPNLVLFVADTFRADGMEVYGGDPELTPNLNALALNSLVFERAWGTSTWTLPSQASLFSGLLPPQHGASLDTRALPTSLNTITEHLAAHGYRTGAVTDGSWLSPRFHFDQGFDWFYLHLGPEGWSLQETLRRASEFQESDDGRPTFLFVHTYRTHEPYRSGSDESRVETKALMKELLGELRAQGNFDESERFDTAQRYKRFYQEGVRAFDAQFGPWWQRARATWPESYLLFTSDHGEAFYEHRYMGHRGKLWDETLRVPLLIQGPGLPAERRGFASSLVDVPRTLAALADVPPDPAWEGVDLVALDEERPVYGFWETVSTHELFVVQGGHKICAEAEVPALQRNELLRAYDLARDPGETRNVAAQADWAAELLRSRVAELCRLLEQRARFETLTDEESESMLEELRAIGYGD